MLHFQLSFTVFVVVLSLAITANLGTFDKLTSAGTKFARFPTKNETKSKPKNLSSSQASLAFLPKEREKSNCSDSKVFVPETKQCVYQKPIDESCQYNIECYPRNSHCVAESHSNAFVKRCRCKLRYRLIYDMTACVPVKFCFHDNKPTVGYGLQVVNTNQGTCGRNKVCMSNNICDCAPNYKLMENNQCILKSQDEREIGTLAHEHYEEVKAEKPKRPEPKSIPINRTELQKELDRRLPDLVKDEVSKQRELDVNETDLNEITTDPKENNENMVSSIIFSFIMLIFFALLLFVLVRGYRQNHKEPNDFRTRQNEISLSEMQQLNPNRNNSEPVSERS